MKKIAERRRDEAKKWEREFDCSSNSNEKEEVVEEPQKRRRKAVHSHQINIGRGNGQELGTETGKNCNPVTE